MSYLNQTKKMILLIVLAMTVFMQSPSKAQQIVNHVEYLTYFPFLCGPVINEYRLSDFTDGRFGGWFMIEEESSISAYSEIHIMNENGVYLNTIYNRSIMYHYFINASGQPVLKFWSKEYINPIIKIVVKIQPTFPGGTIKLITEIFIWSYPPVSISLRCSVDKLSEGGRLLYTVQCNGLSGEIPYVTSSMKASVRLKSRGLTAVEGDDYNSINEVINFTYDNSVRTGHLYIKYDGLIEGDEQFRLELLDPQMATLEDNPYVTVTIQDFYDPPVVGLFDYMDYYSGISVNESEPWAHLRLSTEVKTV
ncbi:hypothetical protein KAR48_20365, partial [bacterium]|nr:hypothetical protein [bacterium]